MKGILHWIMQRQHRQVTLVAGLSLLPFLGLLSSGLLVLVTLQRGIKQSLITAALAMALLAGVAVATGGDPLPLLEVTAVMWGPVLLLAGLLGAYRSMNLVFQASAIVGLVAVSLVLLWLPDPVNQLAGVMEPLKQQLSASGQELTEAGWDMIFRVMPGVMTGMGILACLAGVFLGRVWQDGLEDVAGRFGAEFRQLKLGKVLTAVSTLVIVAAMLAGGLWFENTVWVFVALLVLQGLSLAHFLVGPGGWPKPLLIALYVMLVLVLQLVMPLLTALGFLDNWFDLRRILARNR
ncbi:MAG: hypothetical protein MUP90_10930 [Gammaproteobacteria bacterium]|nr:hypothetical protein [Gammaproteobacteria bacterium]